MLDGNFKTENFKVGFYQMNVMKERKVGDRWTDSDGVEWEQKNGYRSKITKIC